MWRAGTCPFFYYSGSRRAFLRLRLRANACLTRSFLAGLQVKGVPFDFADDVLLNNLPLESAESVLNRLAVLKPYLSQMAPPRLTAIPIRFSALTARHDPADAIIWYLPASAACQLAPAFPSVPCRA
jgi:hypothetical protein